MHFIRKTTVGVTASLLVVLLFSFGLAFSLQRVFGTSTNIKHALKESGFYDSAVGAGLDQAQKEQEVPEGSTKTTEGDEIPIDRPEIRDIIKQAASPTFLQAQSEQSLDSIYAWLDGSSPHLNFTIDLTDVKTRLAEGMGSYVQNRLAGLPVCTPSAVPPNGDIDVFNVTCVPVGFDVNKAAADAKSQILTGDFLKDTKVTPGTVKNGEGKTLEQQLRDAPKAYQRITMGMVVTGVLAVLLATAIVFLSATRRLGLRKVSITCITIGTLSAVLAGLSSFAVQRAEEELAKTSSNQPLQQHIMAVAKLLINDIRHWWMGYGIALVVLGIGALLTLHFTKSQGSKRPEKGADLPSKPAADEPEDAAMLVKSANAEKPKAKNSRKLVQ